MVEATSAKRAIILFFGLLGLRWPRLAWGAAQMVCRPTYSSRLKNWHSCKLSKNRPWSRAAPLIRQPLLRICRPLHPYEIAVCDSDFCVERKMSPGSHGGKMPRMRRSPSRT